MKKASIILILLIVISLILGAIACSSGGGAQPTATPTAGSQGQQPTATPTGIGNNKVSWSDNPERPELSTVFIDADDFYIVADGQKFYGYPSVRGGGGGFYLYYDQDKILGVGDVECEWWEKNSRLGQNVDMRIVVYVHSLDGINWILTEIDTRNGLPEASAEWVRYFPVQKNQTVEANIGETWSGDLHLYTGPNVPYPGEIYFKNMRIKVVSIAPPIKR